VFVNVGEITGVKRVAVIHPLCPLAEFCARRFARAGTPWTLASSSRSQFAELRTGGITT
jgi:hypothetical protein